jgi:hypothetical protein
MSSASGSEYHPTPSPTPSQAESDNDDFQRYHRGGIAYHDDADPTPHSITQYTLGEFVDEGTVLLEQRNHDSPNDPFTGVHDGKMCLTCWALTGIHPDTDVQASIVIPPNNPEDQFTIVRDFDSLLLLSPHLKFVESSIDIFRNPPVSMALSSDVKINATIPNKNPRVSFKDLKFGPACND